MPQPPSPSMQIIWPTDGDDVNAWAPIMDTAVRVTIDGHNHSAGSGAQISIGSLKFDTDISFVDSLGGKHAITNLKTISFFPSPPPVGTNGSFFIADGTSGTVINELYYRTTLGSNVQVSSGATLNVGAFAGTIGGDYTGVAALLSFIDASDAYLFQQQVGAAVRQFAKMQCADLQLFEFKAVGASPVPTQAVTLKSPASLAAGYALTFPAAVPASKQILYVDNTGTITTAAEGTTQSTRTAQIMASAFQSVNGVTPTWASNAMIVNAGSMLVEAGALGLRVGDRITAIRFKGSDSATGPTKFQGGFGTAGGAAIGNTAISAGNGTVQTLAITSGLPFTIAAGSPVWVNFFTTTGTQQTQLQWCEIDYDHP